METDLDIIRARLVAIEQERERLKIAEGVLASIANGTFAAVSGAITQPASPAPAKLDPPPFRLSPPGGQAELAVSVLPDPLDRMHRNEFRAAIEEKRGAPLTDNAFSTLLSRLTTSERIEREGEYVRRRVPESNSEDKLM